MSDRYASAVAVAVVIMIAITIWNSSRTVIWGGAAFLRHLLSVFNIPLFNIIYGHFNPSNYIMNLF